MPCTVAAATVGAVMWEREPDDELRRARRRRAATTSAGPSSPAVTIEITGLSLYTRHGVSEAERESVSASSSILAFELDDCDATVTDRIEETVNYAEVCEQAALGAQERSERRSSGCAPRWPTASSSLGRRVGEGEGHEAGAADPAARWRRSRSRRGRRRPADRVPRARLEGRATGGATVPRARRAFAAGRESRCSRRPRSTRRRPGGDPRPAGLPERALRIARRSARSSCSRRPRGRGELAARGGPRHGPRPIDVDVLLLGDVE